MPKYRQWPSHRDCLISMGWVPPSLRRDDYHPTLGATVYFEYDGPCFSKEALVLVDPDEPPPGYAWGWVGADADGRLRTWPSP